MRNWLVFIGMSIMLFTAGAVAQTGATAWLQITGTELQLPGGAWPTGILEVWSNESSYVQVPYGEFQRRVRSRLRLQLR